MRVPITKTYFPPDVKADALREVGEVLDSGWLSRGPKCEAFEKEFATRHIVAHALATTSCTTALHLALVERGIGQGDEVLVPAFTYVATPNAVEYCRARPIFVDIDPQTFNVDPAKLARQVSPRTRAIMPVHLFGLVADMDPILKLARERSLSVIEDAACATGSADHEGRFAGSFGHFGCFSLHARKVLHCGEGGVLTTQSTAGYQHAKILHSHAGLVSDIERHARGEFALPEFEEVGYNYRLTDIQAAVILAQYRVLNTIIQERRRVAARYDQELNPYPDWIVTPFVPSGYFHTYQSYVLMVPTNGPISRNDLALALIARGISVRQGTHAVTLQDVYREKYGTDELTCPHATVADQQSLSIPIYPGMTEDEQTYVIENLLEILRSAAARREATV